MFVRFRRRGRRLHATLVANRREAGRVRQRHVASLGVVRYDTWLEPYYRGRIWDNLFEMADELGLGLNETARLARSVEARAPFPTPGEADSFRSTALAATRWPAICRRWRALQDVANSAGRN
jgi:hypothetical protein